MKTSMRSVWCTLKLTETPAESTNSLLERWALQVAYYRGKLDLTEINRAVPIIDGISPFRVSGIHLRTFRHHNPDRWVFPICSGISTTEIVPKTASRAKNLATPFLHQDIVESSHNARIKQPLVSSKRNPKFSPIGQLLHGTVGSPTHSLLPGAGHHGNPFCNTTFR
jgi:hypothetical protein